MTSRKIMILRFHLRDLDQWIRINAFQQQLKASMDILFMDTVNRFMLKEMKILRYLKMFILKDFLILDHRCQKLQVLIQAGNILNSHIPQNCKKALWVPQRC
jgi:hypothetical protein